MKLAILGPNNPKKKASEILDGLPVDAAEASLRTERRIS